MNPAHPESSRPARRDADYWIRALNLAPHPEGGYFREVFRSATRLAAEALPPGYGGARALATHIYYLLPAGQRSLFHRLKSDEHWHFYEGAPLRLVLIAPDGALREHRLGPLPDDGAARYAWVPAGVWMGARVEHGPDFALAGCTVTPGFEFEDFEPARRRALLDRFPRHRPHILDLTESDCPAPNPIVRP